MLKTLLYRYYHHIKYTFWWCMVPSVKSAFWPICLVFCQNHLNLVTLFKFPTKDMNCIFGAISLFIKISMIKYCTRYQTTRHAFGPNICIPTQSQNIYFFHFDSHIWAKIFSPCLSQDISFLSPSSMIFLLPKIRARIFI